MSLPNFSADQKLTRVSNAVAAGTSDINSSSVDMQDFEACAFVVAFGAITATAVTSIHVETSSDNSTWNDVTGTSVTVADDDDNQLFYLDIVRPLEQYLRCVVDRGTANAVVDGIIAIQYGNRVGAVTHDATTVGGGEIHLSPSEGTV